MGEFAFFNDIDMDTTVISNIFIDEYMAGANDAQIKIYLYLVRMMSAGRSTSIDDMAEQFNHTEKEVVRSLRYWEKQGLLRLQSDARGNILGIHLCDISQLAKPVDDRHVISISSARGGRRRMPTSVSMSQMSESAQPVSMSAALSEQLPYSNQSAALSDQMAYSAQSTAAYENTAPAPERRSVSEAPAQTTSRTENPELLFIVEQYVGKPLSVNEINIIYYLCDELHFSADLVDYLVQYCVDLGKKDFRYIEKVALNWAENGITTAKQAQQRVSEQQSKKSAQRTAKRNASNAFNQFQQNQYDFDELEKQLLK